MIYNFFKKAQEANIYKTKSRRLRSQKIVGTQKVDIGSWEDLLRAVFIDEECRNLKVVIADGELTRNINHQTKEEVRHFTWKCTAEEGISSISKLNIVNQ